MLKRYYVRVSPIMMAEWFTNGDLHFKITGGLSDTSELIDIIREHNTPGVIVYLFVFEARNEEVEVELANAERLTPEFTRIES